MFIPLRKPEDTPWLPLIPLRESKESNSDDTILLEAAHAFDEQYKWAWNCAEFAYSAIIEGMGRVKIKFKNGKDDSLRGVVIYLSADNILNTSASFWKLTESGWAHINIDANKNILTKNKEIAVNEIWDAIVHEMGHGNIYWKRMVKFKDVNDTPEDYTKWREVISGEGSANPDSIEYKFSYGLYSTYYQEIQAFVSQVYSNMILNLKKMYGTYKSITKEQFWNALIQTNTYQTYKSNIKISELLLNYKNARNILINNLKKYGIEYNDQQIMSLCKQIREESYDALKSAYNNAYQWFYKSFSEN